jgi:hypothetical protein
MRNGKQFYNRDKTWDADTLSAIAEVVSKHIPRPREGLSMAVKGLITIRSKMPHGIHVGKRIIDVPPAYLKYMVSDWMNGDSHLYALAAQEALDLLAGKDPPKEPAPTNDTKRNSDDSGSR